MTEFSTHTCRDPKPDDSADHHCIGPHGSDEPWYCVDCGHEGPEVILLPDGTLNGNALIHLSAERRAMYEADLSEAPWTAAEVESLNAFQTAGVMHPFTCENDDADYCSSMLVATEAGWECPDCDYTQDWAHAFMADGSWREAFREHPLETQRRRAHE